MFAARQGFFNSRLPIIVTGGTKTTVGGYTIRTFNSDDTLSISQGNLTFQYIVAGAGGNGYLPSINNTGGGGGGGGEVKYGNVTATGNIAITIGSSTSGNGVSILTGYASANRGNDATSGTGGTSGNLYVGGSAIQPYGGGGGGGATHAGYDALPAYPSAGTGGDDYQVNGWSNTGTSGFGGGGGGGGDGDIARGLDGHQISQGSQQGLGGVGALEIAWK